MSDRGHAAAEFALAAAVMLLPVALVVTAFGPWSERRLLAEAVAAESARAVAVNLDHGSGLEVAERMTEAHGLGSGEVRLGWCQTQPAALEGSVGACSLERGSVVGVAIEVWTPLFSTPWGDIGGLWVTADHTEPIDLYRSFP